MQPMLVTLFIETNADDLLTEEQGKQRHARQARPSQSALIRRVPASTGIARRPW
jgi:hypothetical protein